ncbi:Hypothetical_protein [Hexamita inflata]|uniref:Hypothetical_protein n=1 Tax=Hexamita inflata TaxID=28002 RepID=A0AA86Q384_9EUKA|nr:Hypothetical protein HINF_LOCUS36473 [Hexamita inflata]
MGPCLSKTGQQTSQQTLNLTLKMKIDIFTRRLSYTENSNKKENHFSLSVAKPLSVSALSSGLFSSGSAYVITQKVASRCNQPDVIQSSDILKVKQSNATHNDYEFTVSESSFYFVGGSNPSFPRSFYDKYCSIILSCPGDQSLFYSTWKNCVKPVQNKYWRTSPYSLSRNFTGFKRGERLIPVVSFVMPISALQSAQTFDQYFGSNNLLLTTPKQHLTLQNFVEQFQDGYLTVSAAVFMDFDVGIDKPFILTSVVYGTFCFVFTALIKCFPRIGKKIIRVDFLFPKEEPKVVRRQYLIM